MPLTPEIQKEIFEKVKSIVQKYCPPLVIIKSTNDYFELIGNKAAEYGSKKQIVPGMFFASLNKRKDMISFHFFPIYLNKQIFESSFPAMLKYLKGKTCFNFKKPEQVNEKELNILFNKGVELWKENGYIQ